MLKHYLVLATKVLLRRKFFTFISLFGISFTLVVLMVVTAIFDHTFAPMAPEVRQDRTLYVESSNEVWNDMFTQSKWADAEGQRRNIGGKDHELRWRAYSERVVEVHTIFARVFGGVVRLVRVMEAVEQAQVSPTTYQHLETRAVEAMLVALTPDAQGTSAGPRQRIEELEARVAQLEKEKRRSERLLLLTRTLLNHYCSLLGRQLLEVQHKP